MINIIQDLMFFAVLVICVVVKIRERMPADKQLIKSNKLIEKYGDIFFVIILLIFCITIGFKVGSVPAGLHVDEAGALYDAICFSKYGVDRYLYKLPVYLINFGGGQSALYAYLASIMIKILGVSITVFRLPAIILSILAMICLYKMIRENYGKAQAICTIFIFAIAPWNIMKSRWGLDCNLMSSLMIISIFAFVKALNCGKNYIFFISGILFGITLYTYAISYIVVPIFIGIILIYMLLIKKVSIKNIIFMAIPLGILALPLILMIMTNNGIIENIKLPIFSIPKLWFYRGGEISLANVPENIKNIFDILFMKDFLNYNAIEEFGTLHKISITLIIFGFIETLKNAIKDIRQKEFSVELVMLISFIVMFLTGLCIRELNINKINAIYIPMIYFAGNFVYYIVKNSKYIGAVIVCMYILNFAMFMNYYFTEFANTDLMYFENDIIQASQRAEELSKEKIFIENCLNQTYIYTVVATPISPYEFNKNLQIQNGIVTKYGKYNFEITQEIDKTAVYIMKNNTEKIEQLKQNGFQTENYGEFTVLWH